MAIHQYNMGIVGNCSYMAYIDTHAAVKWMCMPRFDSSFLFGSLLDPKKGGEFSVCPSGEYSSSQRNISNTNVLVTDFVTSSGRFRVIDCAPRFYQYERYFKPTMLVRKIELLEGSPVITIKCKPVGNYGEMLPETVVSSNHLRYLNFDTPVRLTTDVALSYIQEEQAFVRMSDLTVLNGGIIHKLIVTWD